MQKLTPIKALKIAQFGSTAALLVFTIVFMYGYMTYFAFVGNVLPLVGVVGYVEYKLRKMKRVHPN